MSELAQESRNSAAFSQATKVALSVVDNKKQEISKIMASQTNLAAVLSSKLALATDAKEIFDAKAADAKLLNDAAHAKKAQEDAAKAVMAASKDESAIKEEAEVIEERLKAPEEGDNVEELEQKLSSVQTRGKAASVITREAIDLSIATTTANDEMAELIKRKTEEIAGKEWTPERIFAIFDSDGNGELDKEEIVTALTAMIEKIPTDEQLSELYEKYDTNGDGQFNMEELVNMCKDPLFKIKKKRLSIFKRAKAPITSQEEKDAVQSVKEDMMSLEICAAVDKEAGLSKAEWEKTQGAHDNVAAEIEKLALRLDEAEKELERCERVVTDIEADDWSTERIFAAFDKDLNGQLDVDELQLALVAILEREVSMDDCKETIARFDEDGDGMLSFEEFDVVVKEKKDSLAGFFSGLFKGTGGVENAKQAVLKSEAEECIFGEMFEEQ